MSVNGYINKKSASPLTMNSSSSDVTIINENLEEKLLPIIPTKFDSSEICSSNIQGTQSSILKDGSFSTTYESMPYLSDILKEHLNFDTEYERSDV